MSESKKKPRPGDTLQPGSSLEITGPDPLAAMNALFEGEPIEQALHDCGPTNEGYARARATMGLSNGEFMSVDEDLALMQATMNLSSGGDIPPAYSSSTPEYAAKMLHKVPVAESIDRVDFLVERCRGKHVLSLGCTGPHQARIDEVASVCYGIDIAPLDRPNFVRLDLDIAAHLPPWNVDLVVCGEILEHLGNPRNVLVLVKQYECPVVITVPNAFCYGAFEHIGTRAVENVNIDHVAYYSWRTLKTLVERYGWEVQEFYWYGGPPIVSEGLIMVVEQSGAADRAKPPG